MVDILNLFEVSDAPAEDQKIFKGAILCWLIGREMAVPRISTSFWGPGGRF
jgi:hypothetical protein